MREDSPDVVNFGRRADDQPVTLAADTLPEPADEFGRPDRIVAPDSPPVHVDTQDQTVTHQTCNTEVIVPEGAISYARETNTGLYCPTCRFNSPLDQFGF